MNAEMTIQDTICSLGELRKPYLSHLIPIYNRPGIDQAITILERVRRLEERCLAGDIRYPLIVADLLHFIKTGSDMKRVDK